MENILHETEGVYDKNRDFISLVCWQDARNVKLFFYENIIPLLPKEEKFNLDIQIRKSACSSTANIAEGYGRFYYQEGLQYYRISKGSTYESKDHLISCYDLKYINIELYNEGLKLIEKAKITIAGYIRYVKNQKKGTSVNGELLGIKGIGEIGGIGGIVF